MNRLILIILPVFLIFYSFNTNKDLNKAIANVSILISNKYLAALLIVYMRLIMEPAKEYLLQVRNNKSTTKNSKWEINVIEIFQ